jgi:hypothetical protein
MLSGPYRAVYSAFSTGNLAIFTFFLSVMSISTSRKSYLPLRFHSGRSRPLRYFRTLLGGRVSEIFSRTGASAIV